MTNIGGIWKRCTPWAWLAGIWNVSPCGKHYWAPNSWTQTATRHSHCGKYAQNCTRASCARWIVTDSWSQPCVHHQVNREAYTHFKMNQPYKDRVLRACWVGSLSKSAHLQAWCPGFDPQDPHAETKEQCGSSTHPLLYQINAIKKTKPQDKIQIQATSWIYLKIPEWNKSETKWDSL